VPAGGEPPRRRVYEGRLAELVAAFEAGRRPSSGDRVRPRPTAATPVPQSVFAPDWLVLEYVPPEAARPDGPPLGEMPDLRAAPLVAKAIRDTILSGYGGAAVPEIVCGHAADGAPTRLPHLAVVPLAHVGHANADGHLLGFALVPPRGSGLIEDEAFLAVLRNRRDRRTEDGRGYLTVSAKRDGGAASPFSIGLAPTVDPVLKSLQAARYAGPSRLWATATPLVLDRHVKAGDDMEAAIAELVAAACVNIGLPRPIAVVAGKHTAIEGAVPAWRSGKSPAWTGWRLPPALASRRLVHAVIAFEDEVAGPVILGAGRYCGLGLCLPLNARTGEVRR